MTGSIIDILVFQILIHNCYINQMITNELLCGTKNILEYEYVGNTLW